MPKKEFNIGVVGAGVISKTYIETIKAHHPELHITKICAAHLESAQRAAKEHELIPCTLEELLADPDIDIVLNVTPPTAHYEVIRAALEAGKHVYTEKTLVSDPKQGRELADLAEEKGLYLCSAPDTFLGSCFQTARKAIDEGRIGDVTSFMIAANRNNSLLTSVFAFLRQPGAGIVYDYAVYYVTALVDLLGPVARLTAQVKTPFPTHVNIIPRSPLFGQVMDTPNESQVYAVMETRGGVSGTFHINADSHLSDQGHFVIYGTKGILSLGDANRFGCPVRLLPDNFDFFNPPSAEELPPVNPYSQESRGLGLADMAKAIAEGRPARTDRTLACHVLEVLESMLESGASGQWKELNSTCERPEPLYQAI